MGIKMRPYATECLKKRLAKNLRIQFVEQTETPVLL